MPTPVWFRISTLDTPSDLRVHLKPIKDTDIAFKEGVETITWDMADCGIKRAFDGDENFIEDVMSKGGNVYYELNVDATSITAFSFCSWLSAKCGKLCVFITNVYIYICVMGKQMNTNFQNVALRGKSRQIGEETHFITTILLRLRIVKM